MKISSNESLARSLEPSAADALHRNSPEPVLVAVEDSAAVLQIGRTKLDELLASGHVRSVHIGWIRSAQRRTRRRVAASIVADGRHALFNRAARRAAGEALVREPHPLPDDMQPISVAELCNLAAEAVSDACEWDRMTAREGQLIVLNTVLGVRSEDAVRDGRLVDPVHMERNRAEGTVATMEVAS